MNVLSFKKNHDIRASDTPHRQGGAFMKKYGWPLIISAGLIVLAHYLFNQPFGGSAWRAAEGYAEGETPAFNYVAFFAEYVGWVAYSHFFMWLYRKVQYTNVKEAMLLSFLLWAFVAFPVVAVQFIFLGYSVTLIALDGFSTLVCMMVAGNLLWALSIHGIPKKTQAAVA
jgi:hypothetical protein